MSLVDYASSSDDEAPDFFEEPQLPQDNPRAQQSASEPPPPPTQTKSGSSSDQEPKKILDLPPPSLEKLPDASLLLNSPAVSSNLMNASDHSTRVAAALAENALRKRDSNGLAPSTLRSKVPRGNLPPSRTVPDTSSGVLVPPQLKGRYVDIEYAMMPGVRGWEQHCYRRHRQAICEEAQQQAFSSSLEITK